MLQNVCCRRTASAEVVLAILQEMSRDDQRTQVQMVHLDTEIKELAMWQDNIARMADVLATASDMGPVKIPEREDFPSDWPPSKPGKASEPDVSADWWEPAGVNRGMGEEPDFLDHSRHCSVCIAVLVLIEHSS